MNIQKELRRMPNANRDAAPCLQDCEGLDLSPQRGEERGKQRVREGKRMKKREMIKN